MVAHDEYAEGLEYGRYLVGREDGAVEPFFIEIDGEGAACDCVNADLMDHALANPGWWWRRIGIPNVLPKSFSEYPEAPDEWDVL